MEQDSYMHLLGAGSALASAFCWALAAVLFRKAGSHVSATGLNFSKGVIAFICLGLLLLITETGSVSTQTLLLLSLSGIIGICLGDTLYFVTLARLGPRLTLLIGSLIPVTAGIFSIVFLHETISVTAFIGILLTIAGVAYVLWEKSPEQTVNPQWFTGISLGLLFVSLEASGIILTRIGVQDIPSLQATFIRQTAAIIGLTFWGLATGSLINWLSPIKEKHIRNTVLVAAFIGAFLGTWLSVFALKHTYTSVAAALNSTSPLFVLPIVAFMLHEKISRQAIAGTLIAVAGIGIYFLSLQIT